MVKALKIAFLGVISSILGWYPLDATPVDLSAQYGASVGLATVDTTNPQSGFIGPFGGLNTRDNSAIIGSNQAQDMLNVDITPGGKSVKKRDGFSLDTTFTYSTSPVHGTYKFFDASGNEVRLAGQDAGLYASVSGASWVRVATGTVGATWQCTDWLGQGYCVTSSRDTPVKTNGQSAGTTYEGTIPAGTLIASTADRLLVGNTAANPSRLYYSGSTNFVDFTLGTLVTSSSFEDITAPGSQLTHLTYQYGNWLWWKDQSFGFITGTDQTNLNIFTVSNTVGTFDNTDVFWQGLDYFRGTDAHIYAFDGGVLTPLTRDITPTVTSANRRKANSWTQTSQSDFAGGAAVPFISVSTTIVSGSVYPSSFSAIEQSSTQWTNGSSNGLTIGVSSISLPTNNSGNITDNGFEAGNTSSHAMGPNWSSSGSSAVIAYGRCPSGGSLDHCAISPRSGSVMAGWCLGGPSADTVSIINAATNSTMYSVTINAGTNVCTWTSNTITVSSSDIGKRFKFRFTDSGTNATLTTVDSYILGGNITFYSNTDTSGASTNLLFDDITNGSSTITTGSFTSQTFDAGVSSAIWTLQSNWVVNTSTPSFLLQTSSASASNNWVTTLTSTGTNVFGNRYAKYSSTISVGSNDNALTYISTVTVIAESSGSYRSAVKNASLITSWAPALENDTYVGNSSITYYYRASNTTFNPADVSTPVWVSLIKNATPTGIVGPYFQLRGDFYLSAATEAPHLDDFTFNWFEGNASDKMYATYFDYGLWFAVSLGTFTTTNNRVLRYDLINQNWTLYDIASNGFMTYNTRLQFGSPSVGKIYQFGGVYSDENAAINSYWKSKDFFGASPFLDEDMRTISWYAKSSSGTVMTISYQVNESTTTSYSMNLYDPNRNVIRNNRNFPIGTQVNTINFKFGDNSTNLPWEIFAGGYTYVPRPWNASGP